MERSPRALPPLQGRPVNSAGRLQRQLRVAAGAPPQEAQRPLGFIVGLFQGTANGTYAPARPSSRRRTPMSWSKRSSRTRFSSTTRAHCLGPTATRVWRGGDGRTDVEGIANALDLI